MHHSSNYGGRDNHSIDPELKHCSTLISKTLQQMPHETKWSNGNDHLRRQQPKANNIYQANLNSNAATSSTHYCINNYSKYVQQHQQFDHNHLDLNQTNPYACGGGGHCHCHENKSMNRNNAKKYNQNDMASIHYPTKSSNNYYTNNNYNSNNNNNNNGNNGGNNDGGDLLTWHNQQPRWLRLPSNNQQFAMEHEPLLLDANNCFTNNATTDQHYEHYYSYYYDRQPIRKNSINTSIIRRKLPDTLVVTARKQSEKLERRTHQHHHPHQQQTRAIMSSNHQKQKHKHNIGDQLPATHNQNVLKEKMPNNNIIVSPTGDDWLTPINADELVNLPNAFMDVKDMDAYDDKLNFMYAADGKSLRSKRKLHKHMEATDVNNVNPCCGNANTNTNNNNDVWLDDEKACGDSITLGKNDDYKKLPTTPPHKSSTGKKCTLHTHRVFHYGNQSPRLQRLSPRHICVRSKSPALTIQNKSLNHRTAANADGNFRKEMKDECYVKKFTPAVTTPVLTVKGKRLSTQQHQQIRRERGGGVVQNTDGDSIDDSDANVGADDDDDDDIDNDIDELDNVSGANDSSDTNDTSDSEDGYRVYAYKMAQSLERISFPPSTMSSDGTDEEMQSPSSVLVPSLFPNVPPYLAFSTSKQKGPNVPAELHRVLKWRVTNVMPKVVRCTLANSGMRLLKKTNDWMGIWGKHMKSPCFKTIRPYQKMNHLPGSFKIGRKDSCWKNLLKQMNKHGKKEFGFMPKTYIIPHDLNLLRKHWPKYAQRNVKWIIKPPASARGTGIRVVDRWAQIPKRRPLIVQKYIERPLLINGSKFDLRLYVLVTSINPLRVFMYHNGLARFASVKYSDRSDTLNDRCMHLTNYSINKFSSNYAKNEDVNACHGHKWTIKSLWSYLANRGVRTDYLWEALRNLVLRTILAGEQSINNMIRLNMESKYSCFELFGFDVLLDADLIPWLLEVNISPSLHSELPLDAHVKAPLVQGVLNTALFQVPPKLSHEAQRQIVSQLELPPCSLCYDKRLYINYLSRAEKIKHTTFTRKTLEDRDDYINNILENLTPDDVRCLIVAEDELARSTPLERIFPTKDTYKYLKFTDSPRYYNRLLDAWETRYGHNRAKGIALLRKFCEDKYHLEVPPSPAKKLIKRRTRTLIMSRKMGTQQRMCSSTTTSKRILQIHWNCRNSRQRNNILRNKKLNNKNNNNEFENQSSKSTSSPLLLSSSSSSSSLSLEEPLNYDEMENNDEVNL